MKDIVVEVRRGLVTGLYCDIAGVRFVVVDFDLSERVDLPARIGAEQDHEKLRALPLDTGIAFREAISAV
jgi:hypothetical protein